MRTGKRWFGLWLCCLLLAVALGLPRGTASAASFQDGLAAYDAGRFQDAAALWLELAKAGDVQAQHALGKLYESGLGVPQSYDEAARWYGAAAAQGLPGALNNLGLLYNTGRGLDRDPLRAASLWRQAAEQGHVHAQYNLALAFYLGEGAPLDDREAAYWFWRAASAGLPEAQFAMGQMYRMGVGTAKDPAGALAWYELAATQGHAEAARKAAELKAAGTIAQMPPAPTSTAESLLPPASLLPLGPLPVPQGTGDGQAAAEDADEGATVGLLEDPKLQPVAASDGTLLPPPAPKSKEGSLEELAAAAAPAPQAGGSGEPPPPPAAPKDQLAALKPATDVTAEPAPTLPASLASLRSDPNGTDLAWFGTLDGEADARALAATLTSQFPAVFASFPPSLTQADIGGRPAWRVVAGPFADRNAAAALCSTLRQTEPNLFCTTLVKP